MSQGLKRPGSSRTRLLVVLAAVSLVLFTFSARDPGSGPVAQVRGVVQTICLPVRMAGAFLCSPFEGLGNVFTNLTADEATLQELKAQNEQLKAQNAQLSETSQAAERLEALLELKDTYNLQSTGARVVSGSVDSGSTSVTIDKGSSSGIAVGMPVTDRYGVIGQVSQVGPSTATVRLITDERSGVSAMVQSTRAQGQLRGQGGDELSLTLVRADQSVKAGDLVVTSGLGGVFPKGLLLGTVTSVEKPSGALYYTIAVAPASSVSNLEEVLVITSLTDEQKASAEDAAQADAQEAGRAPAAQQTAEAADADGTTDDTATDGTTGSTAAAATTGSGQEGQSAEADSQSGVAAGGGSGQ